MVRRRAVWSSLLAGRSGKGRRSALAGITLAAIALPASAAVGPTVADLVEVADLVSLSPSPDGGRVAFRVERPSVQRNSYVIDWQVADLATGGVKRVSGGGEPIYGDAGPIETEPAIWSGDGHHFYHRALVDGAIGLWRTAADGSGSTLVGGSDSDVEHLEKSPDGAALLYRLGPSRAEIERAEKREYDEGILVGPSVEMGQSLYRGGSVNGRMASQRLVGRWYSRGGLLWRSPRRQYRLDLSSGAVTELAPIVPGAPEPFVPAPAPGVSATSATGEVAHADWAEGRSSLGVRRGQGKITCVDEACRSGRIAAVAWRPGREEVVFTVQDQHFRQTLYAWDLPTARVRKLVAGDGLMSGSQWPFVPCAVTAMSVICVAAAAVSPPRLEKLDLDTGQRTILYDPNPQLRGSAMLEVEHIGWRLPDGGEGAGTLVLPPGAARGRAPLIITYYYCPGYLRGGAGDHLPLAPLADAGFVVACLNMAPSSDPRDGMARYRTALASVREVVRQLAARGLVDPSRVGMGGFSAGSEATMWVAMHSRLLAAAAVASPQYAPSNYWMQAMRGRDEARVLRDFLQLGAPDETPDRWRLISPALNVDRIKAPLLMQMPEQEARSQMELFSRLSNTTTPVELFAFPDEAHIKMQPRHRYAEYRRNLHWFRYWLQGYVDPDPVQRLQYERWDEMRRRRDGPSARVSPKP